MICLYSLDFGIFEFFLLSQNLNKSNINILSLDTYKCYHLVKFKFKIFGYQNYLAINFPY